MADFKSGVKRFIGGKTEVIVKFPVDFKDNADICCEQCPYLSSNKRMCQINKQIVHYPARFVGVNCPLKIEILEDNDEHL